MLSNEDDHPVAESSVQEHPRPRSAPGALREKPPADKAPGPRPAKNEPADEPDESARADESDQKPRGNVLRRHPIAAVFGAIVLVIAAGAGFIYLDYAGHFESTDDAFIAARQYAVAPKVSGYVSAVLVTDNQHVAAGDVIARIDDRDYRTALEEADAQVASAQANLRNIDAQITVQKGQIEASEAQVEQAQAVLTFAREQAARYQDLAQRGAGTVQNAQQYSSSLRQQEASLASAQASLLVARRQLDPLEAQRGVAAANVSLAQAQRDQAVLNLSYTTVTAAESGRVVELTAAAGEYAQAGTSLTMFVPDDIWVTANFKETQLARMRPGQPVTMSIDAYPDHDLTGHVASVQPGSGTAFSLLPAENATGNYVKIVQRVPVKLVIDNPPADAALGPGMSVVPTVRVEPQRSLYEEIMAALGARWGRA
jgi:membrane fusion protein (multidrug efflux system)